MDYDKNCFIEGDSISITWEVADILEYHPRLTEQEARNVLYYLEASHDAGVGINWDVIEFWVTQLSYPCGEE